MALSSSVPVAPYRNAKPSSRVAVLMAPRKKYLMAASMLRSAPRPMATKTYVGSEHSSNAKNSHTKSVAWQSNMPPHSDSKMNA